MKYNRDDVFELADSLFFTFMEHTDVNLFIESDPNNKGSTRNTDQGMELYADIEQELLRYFKIEI
tara:strand:+ start:676 stop:870 length:195 start_codon:yes stop_codon:yes gene_type:complete